MSKKILSLILTTLIFSSCSPNYSLRYVDFNNSTPHQKINKEINIEVIDNREDITPYPIGTTTENPYKATDNTKRHNFIGFTEKHNNFSKIVTNKEVAEELRTLIQKALTKQHLKKTTNNKKILIEISKLQYKVKKSYLLFATISSEIEVKLSLFKRTSKNKNQKISSKRITSDSSRLKFLPPSEEDDESAINDIFRHIITEILSDRSFISKLQS